MSKVASKNLGSVAVFLGGAFVGALIAGWFFESDNYDDCVLESVKGVATDAAARIARQSCRNKFPEKDKAPAREIQSDNSVNPFDEKWRELTAEELNLLNHDEGSIDSKGNLVGVIHNGNDCIRPSSLKIAVFKNLQNGEKSKEIYQLQVSIFENRASDFKVKVTAKPEDFVGYSVVEATGAYFLYIKCP